MPSPAMLVLACAPLVGSYTWRVSSPRSSNPHGTSFTPFRPPLARAVPSALLPQGGREPENSLPMAFHAPPITGSPPPPVVPSPPQCATPVSAQSSQPPNRLGFDISAPELALTKDASFVPLHSSIESCSSSPASSVYVPAPLPEVPELGLIGPVASFDLPRSEATVAESGSNLIAQLAPPESEVAMPTLRELAAFCLPSLGIWLSSPCLSLIDTSVVGMQCATSQLAALGPSTKLCDDVAFFCTVLSAATTNLAAAAFAQNDSPSAKHIIAS